MPTTIPNSPQPDLETPRGPSRTPGVPDRSQEEAPKPPVQKPDDSRNPNDPALLPIGDPAGMA
ncbi:hypothetical protein HFC70_20100 [Agrobacterium sp. a22-2]|uniref:hypothetical protein n=1 Tax=Agrobacterium sp. a22-2 TaxID=2283840 RepID=UPI0014459CAC|nr:hypothetical protein [Agrobacterium sp. a22-2]NKN38657.1 hypothetical protein [Agrobacterium sp. a22-2]